MSRNHLMNKVVHYCVTFRRSRLQFSLRAMLIGITLFAVLLGIRENIRSAHIFAMSELQKDGIGLYDFHIDPVGPNWMWRWDGQTMLPAGYLNEQFGSWFEDSPLCTLIKSGCIIDGNPNLDVQIEHLSSLLYLTSLYLREVEISADQISTVAQLPHLEFLHLTSDTINEDMLRSLTECRNLRYLEIAAANIPDHAHSTLCRELPDCSVNVVIKSH